MSEGTNRAAPRRESNSGGGSGVLGSIFRSLTSLFFVGVSVMCVYNVFGVGEEVEKLAKEKACQGQPLPCNAQYTKGERNPWAHTYKMYTSVNSAGTVGNKDVVCQRQYILLGDYSCKIKGEPESEIVAAPDGTSSVKPPSNSVAPIRFPPKVKATGAPKPAASAAPAPATSQ
jgi:hypothetical protein